MLIYRQNVFFHTLADPNPSLPRMSHCNILEEFLLILQDPALHYLFEASLVEYSRTSILALSTWYFIFSNIYFLQ